MGMAQLRGVLRPREHRPLRESRRFVDARGRQRPASDRRAERCLRALAAALSSLSAGNGRHDGGMDAFRALSLVVVPPAYATRRARGHRCQFDVGRRRSPHEARRRSAGRRRHRDG
jgi:hypothetical protein